MSPSHHFTCPVCNEESYCYLWDMETNVQLKTDIVCHELERKEDDVRACPKCKTLVHRHDMIITQPAQGGIL